MHLATGRKKRRGFCLRLAKHATSIPARSQGSHFQTDLTGCARRVRAYSEDMNAEPPSSSALSSLWQQVRAVLDLVLDLSFKRFVTPQLVRMLYVLSLLAALMYAVRWMFSGFWGLIMAPVALLFYLIIARVTVELILAIFRIAEHIAPMGDEQGTRPAPKPRSFTDPVK